MLGILRRDCYYVFYKMPFAITMINICNIFNYDLIVLFTDDYRSIIPTSLYIQTRFEMNYCINHVSRDNAAWYLTSKMMKFSMLEQTLLEGDCDPRQSKNS